MQDNAPERIAEDADKEIRGKYNITIHWLRKSPDLSPVENFLGPKR